MLSQKQIQILPDLISLFNLDINDLKFYYHFYNPIGLGDWFIAGKISDGDSVMFLTLVILDEERLQVIDLKQFENIELPFCHRLIMNERFQVSTYSKIQKLLNS